MSLTVGAGSLDQAPMGRFDFDPPHVRGAYKGAAGYFGAARGAAA